MDVYAEKKIIMKSFNKKRRKETIFTIRYMPFIRPEYIGRLSKHVCQKRV